MAILLGGQRGSGGRSFGRLGIAAVIVIIGLVSYFMRSEVNPVTGEKQHIAMSVDQEKALGLQAAPEMAQQMGGALDPDKDPDARLVAEVGNRIVNSSGAQKSPYVDNFNFYLLADPKTINAFALPGGQVFITRALFDRLQNEAQLAGVLGHEIGHVIGRHAAEHMAKQQLGQMIATGAGVAASDDRGHGQGAAMAAMMVNQMTQLHFSRADESEADKFGLQFMQQTGYTPEAMLGVMQILEEASKGGSQPQFLATHPDPKAREKDIEAYLHENFPNGVPKELTTGKPLHGGSVER
jgi:predicted Zn-dependent protease